MIVAKCISKNRDHKGVIVNYTLQDQNGQRISVTGQQIKQVITSGQINIINLQIDKAGRLVDKAEEKHTTKRGAEQSKTNSLIIPRWDNQAKDLYELIMKIDSQIKINRKILGLNNSKLLVDWNDVRRLGKLQGQEKIEQILVDIYAKIKEQVCEYRLPSEEDILYLSNGTQKDFNEYRKIEEVENVIKSAVKSNSLVEFDIFLCDIDKSYQDIEEEWDAHEYDSEEDYEDEIQSLEESINDTKHEVKTFIDSYKTIGININYEISGNTGSLILSIKGVTFR